MFLYPYRSLLFSLIGLLVPYIGAQTPTNLPMHHASGVQPNSMWQVQVASFEAELGDSLTIEAQFTSLLDDERRFQPILLEGPYPSWLKGWRVPQNFGKFFSATSHKTQTIGFELRYDTQHLPETYRRIQIGMRDEDGQIVGKSFVYLYFTPYDTVEVWNHFDFEGLNRRWDSMHQADALGKKSKRVTLTDKDKALAAVAGRGQGGIRSFPSLEKPQRALSIPGLAYTIPVEGESQAPNHATKMDFSGTIEGQVVTDINGSNLSIVDMAVEVWEIDVLGDALLATGFTGEDGLFSIDFQATRPLKQTIEVYIVVVSQNQSDMIRVRTRLGWIRNEAFFRQAPAVFEEGVNRLHDFGTLSADSNDAKPQLLHWANRCRQFVDQELPGVLPDDPTNRLDIMLSFTGSGEAYFFPGGYVWDLVFVSAAVFGLAAPVPAALVGGVGSIFISNHDAIYFGADREEQENTAMHEFGHYLMWHLQNESWIDILQASFSIHFLNANNPNPKLTWTEGFATGFYNIIDTWSQADDGEFNTDGFGNYEDRTNNGAPIEGFANLTHGFFSEWNVGCVLYDLWDGPTQTLRDGSVLATASDYDDGGIDPIELSFAQIVQPLQNNAGTGGFHMEVGIFGVAFGNDQEAFLLTDITEYHGALMAVPEIDCQLDRAITDLFNEDSVNNFNGTNFLNQDQLSSDILAFNRDVTTATFNAAGVQNGVTVNNFSVDVSELRHDDDIYNLASVGTSASNISLTDDLLVSGQPARGSAIMFFNGILTFGWQSLSNSYSQLVVPGIFAGSQLDVDLCGGMTLEVNEGGKLIVGNPNTPPATVRLTSGSTLILGGDHTGQVLDLETTYNTMVSMGTLEIHSGSRFIVEAGATLIFNRGGNIDLIGGNSILEVHGDLIVSEMANFRPEGDGLVVFGLPDLGGAPNVTVNNQSVIQFFELDIELVSDTYFRPDNNGSISFLMEFGTASMGGNSYIHTGTGELVIDYMSYFAGGGAAGSHQGIWVNNFNHSISNVTVMGGAPGIWSQISSVPLEVTEGVFLNCETGILTGTGGLIFQHGSVGGSSVAGIESQVGGVYVEDVVFTSNTQAIFTDGGGGTLHDVTMRDGNTGWRALNPSSDIEVINTTVHNNDQYGIRILSPTVHAHLENVILRHNMVGLHAEGGMSVRLQCSDVINNQNSGLVMMDGALLDMEINAYNTLEGSDINLALIEAAAPILDEGHNRWTTTSAGDFNILGTITGGTCACTNGVDGMGNPICGAPWYFSDISGDLLFSANSFTTTGVGDGIDITDAATGECSYIPQTSNAIWSCVVPNPN